MKFKTFAALSIALLMLLILVAPVLAANPNALVLNGVSGGEAGTGTATLRATHTNQCKVSINLEGASSLTTYQVYVYDGSTYQWAGTLTTDMDGNERFRGTTFYTFPEGVVTCHVALGRSNLGDQIVYTTNSTDLTFR